MEKRDLFALIRATLGGSASRAAEVQPDAADIEAAKKEFLLFIETRDSASADRALSQFSQNETQFPLSFYYFLSGRLKNELALYSEAIAHLEESRRRDETFPWAHYELAFSHFRLKDVRGAAESAERFSKYILDHSHLEGLNETHLAFLFDAAGLAFAEGLRREIEQTYRALVKSSFRPRLPSLRLAEISYGSARYAEAAQEFSKFLKTYEHDQWSLRLHAKILKHTGSRQEILGAFVAALAGADDAFFQHFAADVLVAEAEGLLPIEGEEAAAIIRTIAPRHGAAAEIMRLLLGKRTKRLVATLTGTRIGEYAILAPHVVRFLSRNGEYKEADRILALLTKVKNFRALSSDYWSLRFETACIRQDFHAAKEALDSTPAELSDAVQLPLRRFELNCFMQDFSSAQVCLAALGDLDQLPMHALAPVIRFFAETGRWTEIIALVRRALAKGYDPSPVAHQIVMACRQTGETAALLGQLREQAATSTLTIGGRRVLHILAEDIALQDPRALADLDGIELRNPHVERRIQIKRLLFDPVRSKREAVYFCVNAKYCCAGLTALTSLVINNPFTRQNCDFFFVADEETHRLYGRSITSFAERLGISLEMITEKTLFAGEKKNLRASYGLFTGGNTLSRSAFYRIYFADYLHGNARYKDRKYARAFYFDSDVVFNPGIERVFEVPPDLPLYARLEVQKPEVINAANRHGIEPGRYFNSGVLAFNFNASRFNECIKKTIDAAETRTNELVFQDQCALNIGFHGAAGELTTDLNHFVQWDNASMAAQSGSAVVLHFLNRPKPWDSQDHSRSTALWFEHLAHTSMFVSSEDLESMLKKAAEK